MDDLVEVVGFIKDRMATRDDIARLETEMFRMRDDIRAIDGKVSGIWNVLDLHTDRIKKLETEVQRLKQKG